MGPLIGKTVENVMDKLFSHGTYMIFIIIQRNSIVKNH